MTPEREPDAALTVRDVARMLGLSTDSVKDIPPAELPYFRNGGERSHRRYQRPDVEAYIAARRVTT